MTFFLMITSTYSCFFHRQISHTPYPCQVFFQPYLAKIKHTSCYKIMFISEPLLVVQ